MLEKIVQGENVYSVLTGILTMMCLHLLFQLGKFVWEMWKKKSEVTDKNIQKLVLAMDTNTKAVQDLAHDIVDVKGELSQIPKFKKDLSRLFTAIKHLAGDEWPEIRKAIMEDELPGT